MDSLGGRLAITRAARQLTMQKVADKIGIARPTYAGYESDYRVPDVETLGKLAKLFMVTTDYLIYGSSNEQVGINISKEELEFLDQLRINPDIKVMINGLLDSTKTEKKIMLEIWRAIKNVKI